MNSNYVVLVDENGVPYLAHHGIKGQKWGVRRFQNPDGTLTEAGKDRYGEDSGPNKRQIKREARQEWRNKRKEIMKEHIYSAAEHQAKQTINAMGLDSKNPITRLQTNVKNEYDYKQRVNSLNQKSLDARREYRAKIGKKRVDTLGMKITQMQINDIKKETYDQYAFKYGMSVAASIAGTLIR